MSRFLFLAVALGCAASPKRPPSPSTRSRSPSFAQSPSKGVLPPPTDFTLKRFPEGTLYSLSEDRGSVVLLDVWATWCEPCRDVLPIYQALSETYRERGFRVYALNVDQDLKQVTDFLEETHLQLPVLTDTTGKVADELLNVRLVPTRFLIDRKGRIRFTHAGVGEGFLEPLQRELDLLLNEGTEGGVP